LFIVLKGVISMLVIAIASQKGGCGKTTLSGHLAVEAEKAGAGPVAVIDADPQGSLSGWWNARIEKSPAFAKVSAFDLENALQILKQQGIRLVVIDTPPAITDTISHVIAQADLVIVPTRPSPHDLRAVGATIDLAEIHKKPLIFVVNGATAKARITSEAAVTLSQHGMVAPVTLHNRVDFAASMVDGRTVGEVVPRSQSAKEVADLWIYVQTRLARLAKGPALSPEIQTHQLPVGTPLALSDKTEPLELPPEIQTHQLPVSTPLALSYKTEPLELPPIVCEGRASPIRDAEQLTNGATEVKELHPWGDHDPKLVERRESPREEPWFTGADRKANNFGRRNAVYRETAYK
jgi:chromosome partitioning protein